MEKNVPILRISLGVCDSEIYNLIVMICHTLGYTFAYQPKSINDGLYIVTDKELFLRNVEDFIHIDDEKKKDLLEFVAEKGIEVNGKMSLSYTYELKII